MQKILFVCAGNTCRSPMAEAIFNRYAHMEGISQHYHASSAGLFAYEGQKASVEAIRALQRHGMDLPGHESKNISAYNLDEFDLIIAMTEQILSDIMLENPTQADKLRTLCQWGFDDDSLSLDISDPFGGSESEYERVFEDLDYFLGSAVARLKREVEY
ncbi:MAG: hypothetical protein FWG30_01655 [Eubacteriaceae bacterium]|nr:hypothetical protein [Eubacteriaceae bacterium]